MLLSTSHCGSWSLTPRKVMHANQRYHVYKHMTISNPPMICQQVSSTHKLDKAAARTALGAIARIELIISKISYPISSLAFDYALPMKLRDTICTIRHLPPSLEPHTYCSLIAREPGTPGSPSRI